MPPQRKEGCRAYSFEREDKGVYNKVNDCSPNHEKRAQDAPFFSVWRRRWDSNPRYPEVQLISSQSRYDHFDTSPYMLTRIREVNALFNFIRILIRTQRVLKLLVCGKPAWLKALLSFDFSKQRKISSQSRYDHFDTSPFLFFYSYLFSFYYPSALSLLSVFLLCCFLPCFAKSSFKIP